MDEDLPDDDLELGPGEPDDVAEVVCPWCGEQMEIALDPGGGAVQQYIEDCQVCCRPWRVSVQYDADGFAAVAVDPEGDADSPE